MRRSKYKARVFPRGVKSLEREPLYLSLSSADITAASSCISIPPYISTARCFMNTQRPLPLHLTTHMSNIRPHLKPATYHSRLSSLPLCLSCSLTYRSRCFSRISPHGRIWKILQTKSNTGTWCICNKTCRSASRYILRISWTSRGQLSCSEELRTFAISTMKAK